jgi:hypothetical protein
MKETGIITTSLSYFGDGCRRPTMVPTIRPMNQRTKKGALTLGRDETMWARKGSAGVTRPDNPSVPGKSPWCWTRRQKPNAEKAPAELHPPVIIWPSSSCIIAAGPALEECACGSVSGRTNVQQTPQQTQWCIPTTNNETAVVFILYCIHHQQQQDNDVEYNDYMEVLDASSQINCHHVAERRQSQPQQEQGRRR